MERTELLTNISRYLGQALMLKNTEVGPDDKFVDLGLDSMGIVEFVGNIEDDYNISISDNEVEKISTLNDAADLIMNKILPRH